MIVESFRSFEVIWVVTVDVVAIVVEVTAQTQWPNSYSLTYLLTDLPIPWWGLLMWEIGRRLGHYGNHPCPRVADRGTPSRVDKRDREGAADKQRQGEGKLWSQYVIINREEGKGKPPRLFPKTGYPLGYPEPALQQKTEEKRENTWITAVKHN